jgi:hypothetical protein
MAMPRVAVFAVAAVMTCGLFARAPVADAHHSVAGQFDLQKTVTVSGVVSKVHWVNPHFYIEVTAPQAAEPGVVWRLEGVPIGVARKAGLTKAMLTGHGETVTIVAHPARDGTAHLGYLIKISYPDGKVYQFTADAPGG